jgi:alkane 1-monooxygenase
MIVLAIVPAVWWRVMDPRVVAHFHGDVSRANLSPRKRDKILASYAPPVVEEVPQQPKGNREGGTAVEEVMAASCPGCSYVYDVVAGDEHEGFAAGTAWADIPDDWCCPDCGVREKVDFVAVSPDPACA